MRRALRPTDWGAVLALTFSLLFAAPMIFLPGLPRANDNEHWVYQTANYARALGEGRLYPRWSPHALGGYGAPIPHYYPPAPAYSAALIQTGFIGEPLDAVRLIYIFTLSLGGLPIYALVARHRGSRAALVASLLYTSTPYIAFTTPILLGDLPCALSHLLVPLLLWAVDRLLTADQALDILLVMLATAAVVLTDVHYTALSVFFVTILVLWHLGHNRKAPILRLIACIALGVGAAAFFWLPAILEQSEVRWRALTSSLPVHIELGNVFRTLVQLDPAENVPAPQYTLGTALGVFALASLVPIIRRRNAFDSAWLAAGALCLLLAILFDQKLLLGGAALSLSLGASAVSQIVSLPRVRLQPFVLVLLIALIMLASLPLWLTARPLDNAMDTSAAAQLQYELQGFGVAGLPAGWSLPSRLPQETAYSPALIASYTSETIEKIDPGSIPPGVQLGFLDHTSHVDRVQIQSDFASTISVLTAAFPGWAATATSANVQLQDAPDTGLLELIVPNGINSDIIISLGSTPPRTIGWAASTVALVMIALLMRLRRSNTEAYLADYRLLSRREQFATTAAWLVSALVVWVALAGGFGGLRAAPGSNLSGSDPLRISTDAGIEAVAYETSRAGIDVQLIVRWRALRALDQNLRVQVTLIDPTSSAVLTQSTIQHPGTYPTRRWLPNRYVSDRQWLQLPVSASALPVAARIEVYDCAAICTLDDRVTFFDGQGAPIGQTLTLPIG
jgi:hypothetical protein